MSENATVATGPTGTTGVVLLEATALLDTGELLGAVDGADEDVLETADEELLD